MASIKINVASEGREWLVVTGKRYADQVKRCSDAEVLKQIDRLYFGGLKQFERDQGLETS